jgi:hypothetical protein
MSTLNIDKIAEFVDRVADWPTGDRLALAQKILGTIERDLAPARPKKSLRKLVGLLRRDGPSPTDEEIAQMIDEEIMKKYGS